MQAERLERGEGFRALGRDAIAGILHERLAQSVDEHLDRMTALDQADRRNCCYRRHLLTDLGAIELAVPRTRFAPATVVRAGAAPPQKGHLNDLVLLCPGSLGAQGERSSAAGFRAAAQHGAGAPVATPLDTVVSAFHARLLQPRNRALMLDGVNPGSADRQRCRPSSAGRCWWRSGCGRTAKKEASDFRLARSGSAADWEPSLDGLFRRGLTGEGLEMICLDGGAGLLSPLPIPILGCQSSLVGRTRPYRARHGARRRSAGRQSRPACRVERPDPAASRLGRAPLRRSIGNHLPHRVRYRRDDLDELLTCRRCKSLDQCKRVRTINTIERRFREVRRRSGPMGVFSDRSPMDRIAFAAFNHENRNQNLSAPLLLTQTF